MSEGLVFGVECMLKRVEPAYKEPTKNILDALMWFKQRVEVQIGTCSQLTDKEKESLWRVDGLLCPTWRENLWDSLKSRVCFVLS